ncbi:MAG: PEP-CTERM sorting domain-containing protein [Proteobacteria bacterium]|nr:PEP-CTERM sorting domain-containing protein [Pseudomonadota bacterium]
MNLILKIFTIFFLVFSYSNISYATPITLHLKAYVDSIDDYFGNAQERISVGDTIEFKTFWDSEQVDTGGLYYNDERVITTDLEMLDNAAGPMYVEEYSITTDGQIQSILYTDGVCDIFFYADIADSTFTLVVDPTTGYYFSANGQLTTVPEPATMLLFGTGLAGFVGSRFKKKKT